MTLIEKLQAATGPDRELDAMIWLTIYRPKYKFPAQVLNRVPSDYTEAVGRHTHDGYGGGATAPRYTASIDAALTLLPEGWFTSNYHQGPSGGNWWELSCIRDDLQQYISVKGQAATPAIALLMAILQARGIEQ